MKKVLCIMISAVMLGTSVSSAFAVSEPTDLSVSGQEATVECMSVVAEPLPFGFEIVSVGRDAVTAEFVSDGRITALPYVGIKGTKTAAENTGNLYVLEYDKEYSFAYTVTEGETEIDYNSFITVERGSNPEVVFGTTVRNTVDTSARDGIDLTYEVEENDTMLYASRTYNDYDSYGVISSEEDVDWWKVMFTEDGQANFWLGEIPAGCDYDLTLYDENCVGSAIDWLEESINHNQTPELIQWEVEAGVFYYVKITTFEGASETEEYLFRAKVYPPEPEVPETEEPEPEPEIPTLTFVLYDDATDALYNGPATIQVRGEYDNTYTTTRTISDLSENSVGYNVRVNGYHTYVSEGTINVTGSQTVTVYLTPVGNDISSVGFTNPLDFIDDEITSRFGWRSWSWNGIHYENFDKHLGLDIGKAPNTPILSVCDVSPAEFYSSWDSSMGYHVVVTDNESVRTITYMHMIALFGTTGVTSVVPGGTIGYVGSTGNSTGNHLHIQIYDRGTWTYHDPYLYFH